MTAAIPPAVVLVEPQEPGNIGAAVRVMKNFGLHELILVQPRCSPLDGMARAFAAGATDLLRRARVCESLEEAITNFHVTIALTGVSGRNRPLDCIDLVPEDLLCNRTPSDRIALVFGREETGLTTEECTRCLFRWRLPSDPEFPSLNLAQSVAVSIAMMAEARRRLGWVSNPLPRALPSNTIRAAASDRPEDSPATQGELDRLTAHAEGTLPHLGFEEGTRLRKSLMMLLALAARGRITHREVQLLRGILHRVDLTIHPRPEDGEPPPPFSAD